MAIFVSKATHLHLAYLGPLPNWSFQWYRGLCLCDKGSNITRAGTLAGLKLMLEKQKILDNDVFFFEYKLKSDYVISDSSIL